MLIRCDSDVGKISSCYCGNSWASFHDSDEWTIVERRDSTGLQCRGIKCVAVSELQGGEYSANERTAMRHKSKRTVNVACCHSHLHLGGVLMCQNLVGAKVICSRRMMGANDRAGTATARTRHGAGSEEVNLQSSKREKRQLQSSR